MPDNTPSIAPTIDDLRSALERAECELVCADMIDDFGRRQVQTASARKRVNELQEQIFRLEESF